MAVAGATGIITSAELADNAVTTDKLIDDAVTNVKLLNDSLTVNGTSIDLGASETITAGKILQVVQGTFSSTFSTTSPAETAFVDTGLSVAITPSATSSKILILWNVMTGSSGANVNYIRLLRDSTAIALGDTSSTRVRVTQAQGGNYPTYKSDNVAGQFLDTPSSTSALTYKLALASNGTATSYINRNQRDNTSVNDEDPRGMSTIKAQEIAG